jgi:DNA-binding SARP family transcriptional activator
MVDSVTRPGAAFAQLLRQYREQAGLTQVELARRSGLSATTVRDLEQRRTLRPTRRSVSGLASALRLENRPATAFRDAAAAATPDATAMRPVACRGRVFISVLGPLQLRRGASTVVLTSARQRALLARLALSPGTTVSRTELLDVLWSGEQPPSVVNLLHTYVARLRRTLNPDLDSEVPQMLIHVPGGYRLDLDGDQLDVSRFRRLVDEAEEAADRAPAAAVTRLAEALALWRDDPLADVDALAGHPAVVRLTTQWTAAALRYADLLDHRGDYEPVVHELRRLAERHPLDEQVHARLIVALGATGRQAEAYAEYGGIVRRLTEQLGVGPSTVLLDYHQRLLRQHRSDASAPTAWTPAPVVLPVPRQAPAPVADFSGRAAELRVLRELLAPASDHENRRTAPICVITGPVGIGKTALALATAERLTDAFPDGQLYADLRGSSARPAGSGEVLGRFLHAVGLRSASAPDDDETASALLRSALATRRMLIVLDDARDAAQVRPLLPGFGDSRVVVTTRNRLASLENARRIELPTLSTEEALDMLTAIAGAGREDSDRAALLRIVSACGRLPLALRIAGVRLTTRAAWTPADLSHRLSDPQRLLDELRVGDLDLRTAFAASVERLPTGSVRAFRLLAQSSASQLSLEAAAALLGRPLAVAEDELHRLVDASVLTAVGPAQFRLHEPLRWYGRELAGGLE